MKEELKTEPTLQKIEDLIEYAYPQIDKFPRSERGYEGMATRLKGIMARMADRANDTKKCYYPKSLLKTLGELDKEIAYCKFWVKVAKDLKLLPFDKFSNINDYLSEIGRMTGSWIKTVLENEEKSNHGKK